MKQFIFYIIIFLLFTSCRTSKEVTSVVKTEKEKIEVNHKELELIDTRTTIKERLIKPDEVLTKTDLDLNNMDLIKKLFSKNNPLVKIDSATNTIIESYIDLNNILHQNIRIKPNEIKVTDTIIEKLKNKLIEIDSLHIKESTSDSTHSEIIKQPSVSGPGLFQKILIFLKNTFSIIIIIILVGIIIYLNNVFNLTGIIKKLFNKK